MDMRPLLHKDISYVVKKLAKVSNVEIVTNGDVLTPKVLKLYGKQVSFNQYVRRSVPNKNLKK